MTEYSNRPKLKDYQSKLSYWSDLVCHRLQARKDYTTGERLAQAVLVYAVAVAVINLVQFVSLYMGEQGRFIPLPIPEIWLDKFVEVFNNDVLYFQGKWGFIIAMFFLIVVRLGDYLKKPDKDDY